MSIIGLTDRGASFPRIGELRKGGEKPATGNRPGADLTYFRFTSKDPAVLKTFAKEYGETPQAVNCYLPYATANENFEAWVEEWQAGGLKWRGNGEELVIWQKPDGSYSQEPKPQPKTGGKEVGRLKVIVPELGRLAYVIALTTSLHDIMDMAAALEAYEALRGDLRGIPFVLSRVPRMVSTPSGENGKRARREKWLWHLEAQPAWVQAQLSVMKREALPSGAAMLESGVIADIETGEIMDDDFEDENQSASIITDGNGNDDFKQTQHEAEWGSKAEVEAPAPAPAPVADLSPPMPTAAMKKKFHALGESLYGTDGWDDKRPELVRAISGKRQDGPTVKSSNELYRAEMQNLIDGMTERLQPAE